MPDPAPLDRDLSPGAGLFPGVDGVLAGRFHIEARLGAGGMGEVYRARDTTLRRLVAIASPLNHRSLRLLEKLGLRFERMVSVTPNRPESVLYARDL